MLNYTNIINKSKQILYIFQILYLDARIFYQTKPQIYTPKMIRQEKLVIQEIECRFNKTSVSFSF